MNYRGSGNLIRANKNISLIDTEVLFETEDKQIFKEVALYYSHLWNVEKNELFLNQTIEEGQGGYAGEEAYRISLLKRKAKVERPSVKLIEKYIKRFRPFRFEEGKKDKSFKWRYQTNDWLDEKLVFLFEKFGKPETIDWDFDGRGYTKHTEETKEKIRISGLAAWKKRRAGT